jgi:hypothetical protein
MNDAENSDCECRECSECSEPTEAEWSWRAAHLDPTIEPVFAAFLRANRAYMRGYRGANEKELRAEKHRTYAAYRDVLASVLRRSL